MQRFAFIAILLFASCKSKDAPTQVTENWVLTEKNKFVYKLNSTGNPDTTFVYNQKFKDGLVSDSSISFVVNTWKDNSVLKEESYLVGKNGIRGLYTTTNYDYDSKGRMLKRRTEASGKVLSEQRYFYNDSSRMAKATSVQIKNFNIATGKSLNLTTASANEIGYDTTISIYEYDRERKVVGTRFFSNSGRLLSFDTTLYIGTDPLLTVNLSPKNDTLKRVTYEKRGNVLMTVTETDSFTLFQNLVNGVPIAQKTKYKNRNEQWRSAVLFDPVTGRKREDNLYKLQ